MSAMTTSDEKPFLNYYILKTKFLLLKCSTKASISVLGLLHWALNAIFLLFFAVMNQAMQFATLLSTL